MYRVAVPPNTTCPICNLTIAPYSENVKFMGKYYHQNGPDSRNPNCFEVFWKRNHHPASADVKVQRAIHAR